MNAVTADIQVQSALWEAQPRAEESVRAAIAAAAVHSTDGGELSILLADDSTIRDLNRLWRGLDKPTNVLSFPAPHTPAAAGFLGDIVIAYETLQRECEDEEREFLHHLAHLTVHGFLHLLGYDHRTDDEAVAMEELESRIMTALNMPDPWADNRRDARYDRDFEHGGV